jgi:hypothetical protein
MPVAPDIYTDVLSFVTNIAKSGADADLKAEANRLIGKLLLHRPRSDPASVLAEATEEESRKAKQRMKRAEALVSASYHR